MASDPSGRSYLVIGGDDGDLEAVAIALLELGDYADHLDVALLGAGWENEEDPKTGPPARRAAEEQARRPG